MSKKRGCHSKKLDDPISTSGSDKSVTGIYYGKLSNLIAKKKIKCIYETLDDCKESTRSVTENGSSKSPIEVKIFSKEDASTNRSFFEQGDLSKGCIKPDSGSENSENLGIAIGVQIPALDVSKDLTVVVEFDVVGSSSTSITELKQYTSRMKLSEETPSKMIFNGIVQLQPRAEPLQITDVPLYIIDPKDLQKIVEDPGFSVSYKTSAKSGKSLVVDNPTDVLVKLKVDKPIGKCGEPTESSKTKQNKECCCNKSKTKTKTLATSDTLEIRREKSKGSISKTSQSDLRKVSVDAGTQSSVNLQSKSNQTTSQVSVSSGRDLESKSIQTNEPEATMSSQSKLDNKSGVSIIEPQKSNNAQSVLSLQVVEDKKLMFDVKDEPSEVDVEPTRKESKSQQRRREGRERLERRRSTEEEKLTSQNRNSALRNTATQSSTNKIMENKEISAQYSFISPTYNVFTSITGDSSSTLTDSLFPIKSVQFNQIRPRSIESTSTQWPQSLTSNDNGSDTLTLISDVFDYEKKENNLIVPANTPKNLTFYPDVFSSPNVMSVNFSTQTDLLQKPNTINTYSQYLYYPVEDEILSLNLDFDKTFNSNIKKSQETLNLLKEAKLKLGEYAGKRYFSYAKKPFLNKGVTDECSILQSEENEKDDSFPKYVDKEIDASERLKRQTMFTRFINHWKPAELPVTVAQYHTVCETSNPFQLKPKSSLHDLQNEVKSNHSFHSAKFESELQTVEIDNVNHKLCEEIDSLQKIYEDLSCNVSFIYENQDIFPIPSGSQTKDTEKRSIKNIKSDISKTFIELRGCLSTIDKILSTASLKSVYETPPSSASTSKNNIVVENDLAVENPTSDEIQNTYSAVENDIKKTIVELLQESESIKHEALLNGAVEEPEPPFFFEYLDLLKETNPLLICKSIVDNLSTKSINVGQEAQKEEKEKKCKLDENPNQTNCAKKSIGSCSRIKTDAEGSNKKEMKLKVDNKKNDRITYFCTTFVSKIPKTSFSFGGNSRSRRIHKKEKVADNTTNGDNVKVHEGDSDLAKTCLNIMEPNLNTKNLISINGKNDFLNLNAEDDVGNQNYEKNVSYSNYIAYLNATSSADRSVQDTKNFEKIEKEPHISNLLEIAIKNEVNVLQMRESVLTDDFSNTGSENSFEIGTTDNDDRKPQNQNAKVPPQPPGMILKSPKSFVLAENFNREHNLPSTSTKVYKLPETTDEEEIIRDMDLTRQDHEVTEESFEDRLDVNEDQSELESCQPKMLSSRKNTKFEKCELTTSSDEFIVERIPPKHLPKSKFLKIVTLKPTIEAIIDSDSDETVLNTMQQCFQNNMDMDAGSSNVLLRTARANTNVSLHHPSKSMLAVPFSKDDSLLSIEDEHRKSNVVESDYDGDYETDQVKIAKPFVGIYKSKQELNSPEEIARIEENVCQNDMLERRNLHIVKRRGSSESSFDDYSPMVTTFLISDYNVSDSSLEIFSSGNNS